LSSSTAEISNQSIQASNDTTGAVTKSDVQETGIVTFSTQAARTFGGRENQRSMPNKFDADSGTTFQNIQQFLRTPRPVDNFSWAATDSALTSLAAYELPNIILSSTMPCCKVADFRFFRCDIRFRFKINVNKFAIGSLLVVALPVPTLTGALQNPTSLTAWSGYPHMFIDAGSGPETEFVVPYVHRKLNYDLINDSTPGIGEPWAGVQVLVFNPLNGSSGSNTAHLTTYVSAENIHLSMRAPQNLTPFAPSVAKTRKGWKAKSSSEPVIASAIGGLSTIAKTVSKVVGAVDRMGEGPTEEDGAAGAWLEPLMSTALDIFGFSKPTNFSNSNPMSQYNAKFYASHNSIDNSCTLAFDARNAVNISRATFGTTKDELDINYVCSKPMFLQTINWSTSATPGTVLASWPATPGFCASATTTTASPTFLAYASHMFNYWRGGISYQLNFHCNSFYSGSVGLAFLSGLYTVVSPVTLATTESAPKVICDLKNSTTCNFDVPFVSNQAWNRVRLASRTSTGTGFTYAGLLNKDVSTGLMVLYVQNPLVAPATVPTTIYINLFSSGSSDFQLSSPCTQLYLPVPAVAPDPELRKRSVKRGWVARSNTVPPGVVQAAGEDLANTHRMVDKPSIAKDTKFNAATIGEQVTNLRQLTRCFSYSDNYDMLSGECLTVDPAYYNYDATTSLCTRLDRVARLYCFFRGGMRYKFVPTPTTIVNGTCMVFTSTTASPTAAAPVIVPPAGPFPFADEVSFSTTCSTITNPFVEVMIPFYHKDYSDIFTDTSCSDRIRATFIPGLWGNYTLTVLRAAADDWDAGYLIGPPDIQLTDTS